MSKKKVVFNAYELLNSPEMSAYLDKQEAEQEDQKKRLVAEQEAKQRKTGSQQSRSVSDDELSPEALKRDNISQTTGDITGRANDVWQALKSGGATLIQGAGWLANEAGAHDSGQFLQDIGQIGQEQALANMTQAGREAQKNGVFKEDLSGVNDDWGRGMAQGIAGSAVPSIVGAMLGAPIARGIGAAGEALLGRAAVSEGALGSVLDAAIKYTPAPVMRLAGALPGAAGAGAGEAAVTGATNGAQAYQEVMDAPIESLRKSPAFQSLSKELGSEDAARKAIADRMSIQTAKDTALSTGLIGAAMGGGAVGSLLNKFAVKQGAKEVGKLGAKAAAKEVLKDGAKEFVEEFAQSGPEHYLQNAAKRDYLDPAIDPSTGMLRASLEGGVVGMGQGMGMSGGAHAVNHLLTRNDPQPAKQPQPQPQPTPASTPESAAGYDPIAPNQADLLRRMGIEPDPVAEAATASVESVLGKGDPTAGLVASVMRGDALQPIHDIAAVRANTILPVGSNEGGLYEPQWLPDAEQGESANGLPMPKHGFDSQEKMLGNARLDARDADLQRAKDEAFARYEQEQQQAAARKQKELERVYQDSIVPAEIERADAGNQLNQALASASGEGVAVPNAMQLALQKASARQNQTTAPLATDGLDSARDENAQKLPTSIPSRSGESVVAQQQGTPQLTTAQNSTAQTQADAAPNIADQAPSIPAPAPNISSEPALSMHQNERGQWLIKGDMAQHAQTIREALPGTKLVISQQKGQALVQMPADKNTAKQGKDIRKALDHLVMSGEQLAQRDSQRTAASERLKARNQQTLQIDHSQDDILQAVAKLGGIDTEQALSEWWSGQRETIGHYNAEVPGNLRRQGVFAFKRGGQPIDTVIRRLEGEGYLPEGATPNDLLDALENRSLHPAGMEERARREFEARQQEDAPGEFQQAYAEGSFADDFTKRELEEDTDYFELNRMQREAADAAAEAAKSAELDKLIDNAPVIASKSGPVTEEELDAIFGPQSRNTATESPQADRGAAAGRSMEGAESGTATAEAAPEENGFSLAVYTESDLRREERAAEQQQREVERQRAAADKARQEEETRKEIRRRSEAAADTFVLGGNAEDNLTGQGGLFDAPGNANRPGVATISKSDGSGFATREALRTAATKSGIEMDRLIEKRDDSGNWIGTLFTPDSTIDGIIADAVRMGKLIGTSVRDLQADDVRTVLMAAHSAKQLEAMAGYLSSYSPRAAAETVQGQLDTVRKWKGWATDESLYGGGLFDALAETESQRLKREADALRAKASDLIHANDHRSEDAGRALDDFNDKVIGPAEFAARLSRIDATPAPNGKNSRFEQKIKIAANGVESLRASDVDRVLEQQQSPESLQALADYITQHRPDLSGTVQRDTAALKEENGWSEGPKRGKVGMMLAPGEVVLTASGRETTPFPKFQTRTGKTTARHLAEVDKWLLQNAATEALSRGDTFNAPTFQSAADNPKDISQSDKDGAEEYLFGEQPAVKPSILKPLVGANNAESQSSSAQNTADNNDNWLNELFGIDGTEPAQQSVQRYTGRPKEVDFSLLVPKIRAFVSERIAEADDWAGRKYKHNKKQIHLDGDGPAKHESISISSANESRRRSTIDNLTHQANAAKSLIDRIERGENISHELAQAIEASDADIETIGKPRFGKTRNDQAEAYISNMLLGDRGYRYGKGTLAHLLLVEYENFASTLAASSAQNTGHSSENTAETPQDAASSAETVAAIDALIAEGERRRDAGESPRMSREGLAYPPPAGDGDAMSAMNWLSDAERQQLHDLKQSLPSAASEREAARARIKQKLERRGPSMNGGAIDSNEPKADYTDHYETDLFGNPLPNAGRKTRAAKPAQSGVHRNVHAAPALSGDTAAPAGDYRVRTLVGTESQRTLGARSIQSIDDLAKATSYLYRSAVERFDAIVTDSSGKPLAVVGAFKGAVDQASVYKATLVGEAVRIPGAAHIWFSHNHPSGTASLSSADRALYAALADTFDGSGIQPMGLIAVAGSRYASMEDSNKPIPRSSESMALPVVERELVPAGDDLPAITSPQSARDFANSLYKGSDYQPGMMLLNTQNQLAAWVPLPATAMGALRHSGGLNAIYRAISESNASAVILVHGGELSERISNVTMGQNIAAAVAKLDVRPLDIIDIRKPRSAAETGELIQSGPLYSKANDYTSTQGMSAKDLQAIIAKALPAHLRERVKVEQSRGNNAQQSARSEDNDLIEAEYDPATGQLTLYADALPTPERALFVLSHELTHYGLDAKYGSGLSNILLEARNNPMIAKLAAAIAVDRSMTVNSVRQDIADALGVPVARIARSAAIHRLQVETANEALAELNAAIERNDFAYLQDRYGVAVPKMMRNDLRGRLARMIESVKAWMAKLTGKQSSEYSDKQVWDLLAGVRETVRGGGKSPAGYSDGAAQHSMAASSKTINIDGVTRPTTNSNGKPIAQTEEGLRNFWRWFSPSPSQLIDGLSISSVSRLKRDSEALADFVESQSGISEADRFAVIPSSVFAHVASAVNNDKVLDAVIRSLPVDVVNFLGGKKGAAKNALHDAAVLEKVFSVYPASNVTLGVNPSLVAELLVRMVANAGAKITGLTDGPFKRNSAVLADTNDPILGAHVRKSPNGNLSIISGFGDSKVVDKDGKPLVVYHGTTADVTQFDLGFSGSDGVGYDVPAIFATTDQKLASDYALNKFDREIADAMRAMQRFKNENPGVYDDEYERLYQVVKDAFAKQRDEGRPELGGGANVVPLYMRGDMAEVNANGQRFMAVMPKALPDAMAQGKDGVIVNDVIDNASPATDYPARVFVTFATANVKSAVGNQGTFNGSDPNILRSTAQKQPASAGFSLPEETKTQAAQREVQDNMNRWKQVLEIVREQGGQVDEQNDVHGAEERFHGRAATRIEDFARDEVEPLMQRLADSGRSLQEVEQYLLAQHAEEANARIREIDESRDTAYGMEDDEAQSILAKFAAMPNAAEFKRLANDFRRISEGSLSLYVKAGIVSPEAAHAMRMAYQFYVPVKGGDEDQAARQGTGKGLSVNGKQKRRMGHDMRDEHVLENMLRDRQRAIILAEKNNVGTYLLDLIGRNPDPKLWTVEVLPKQKVLRDQVSYVVELNGQTLDAFNSMEAARVFIQAEAARTGSKPDAFAVSKSSDPYVAMMAKPMLQDNEVLVYVQGRAVRIQLHDPILAGQYRRMGTEQMGRIIEAGKSLNRWLSKVYTGYNPEFFVKNVVRDLFAGTINLTADQGAKVTARALWHWPKAGAAMFKFALTGKAPSGDYGKALQRYRAAGGSTGAAYMGDLERQANTLTELYENYTGAMATLQQGKPFKAARIAGRKLVQGLAHWFEVWNQAGENAFRLATFMAMQESGKTVAESASMAKNVTVNFNRKGELTPQLGALYLFFNPSVQGSQRLWQSLFGGDTKHKAQAWALVGSMAGAALALAMMNRGDDEDEWEAIPDSVKDRNLIIPLGNKRKLTIPLPYGYSFFVSLANRLDAVMHGESAEKASIRLASSLFENFSPVGNPIGDDPKLENMLMLLPTAIKIPALPAANITDFGGPMRPDYKETQPDNEKMWRGTRGSLYDKAAQGIASLHGSPYENNWNDISPETIKYLFKTLAGGTGGFMADSASLLNVLASGSAPDVSEVPFLRSAVRESTVKDARARFYDLGKDAKGHVEAWKRAVEAGDDKAAGKYEQDGELMALGEMLSGYKEQASTLRDLMAEEMKRDDLSLSEKRLKQKMYEKQEADVYSEFIKQFKH